MAEATRTVPTVDEALALVEQDYLDNLAALEPGDNAEDARGAPEVLASEVRKLRLALAGAVPELQQRPEWSNGGRCDHCGAWCINSCMVCGAPQCCPQCCKITEAEERIRLLEKDGAVSAIQPCAPVTQDGPLGGYTVIGQEANELDLKLTLFELAVEEATKDSTMPEDADHHSAEAFRLKREIIEKYAPRSTRQPSDAFELAMAFHRIYERLAPYHGYETKEETRHFDPASTNGKLMLATCEELLNTYTFSAIQPRSDHVSKEEAIRRVRYAKAGVWPSELESGVMFYLGHRITRDEFTTNPTSTRGAAE